MPSFIKSAFITGFRVLTLHMLPRLATFLFLIGTRQRFNLGCLLFDNILRHAESFALKLGIGYPSFIFGILKGQSSSLLLQTDSFSGPLCAIRQNPTLFTGPHRPDTLTMTGSVAAASTDDSTTLPTPETSPTAPDVPQSSPMGNLLVVHLHAELRLLQDHASILASLLRYNQDRQTSASVVLSVLISVSPSAIPPTAHNSPQPTGSGDTKPLHFSDSEH